MQMLGLTLFGAYQLPVWLLALIFTLIFGGGSWITFYTFKGDKLRSNIAFSFIVFVGLGVFYFLGGATDWLRAAGFAILLFVILSLIDYFEKGKRR